MLLRRFNERVRDNKKNKPKHVKNGSRNRLCQKDVLTTNIVTCLPHYLKKHLAKIQRTNKYLRFFSLEKKKQHTQSAKQSMLLFFFLSPK